MTGSYPSVHRAKVRATVKLVGWSLLLLLGVTQVSSCAVPFYWQAMTGQLQLLRKRVPIRSVLEEQDTGSELAAKLRAVLEMRRFAVDELGLPDNKSYETYVDLDRKYVVWNVIAAGEFSVAPKRWCYPFVGCVSYRGFFAHSQAEHFAAGLDEDGYDTYVAGASAYSTLGFFADPVLSTMLAGGEEYVAEVLFHELTHQRLYIKGDSELSEAFATAVAEYGTERWLREQGQEAAARRYSERLGYRNDFAALVASTQEALRTVFASDESPERKRAAKQRVYDDMREQYLRLKRQWGGFSGYDAWFAGSINNAKLAAVATYRHWVPGLRWLLARDGLPAFFEEMQKLATLTASARETALNGWLAEAVNDGQPPSSAATPSGATRPADISAAAPRASSL